MVVMSYIGGAPFTSIGAASRFPSFYSNPLSIQTPCLLNDYDESQRPGFLHRQDSTTTLEARPFLSPPTRTDGSGPRRRSTSSSSQSIPPTMVPCHQEQPTMAEFKAFHGMVCNPRSAQKCVKYFDGCALFADQKDYETRNELASFDFLRSPIPLNLWSYYALVFFSCTGLLSLLGYTKAHQCQEEDVVLCTAETTKSKDEAETVVESHCLHNIPGIPSLTIPNHVIHYIVERSARGLDPGAWPPIKEVRLIRRFEFEFGPLLSVMMCHFVCQDQRFLVEVYAFHHSPTNIMARIIAYTMVTVQKILFRLARRRNAKKEQ